MSGSDSKPSARDVAFDVLEKWRHMRPVAFIESAMADAVMNALGSAGYGIYSSKVRVRYSEDGAHRLEVTGPARLLFDPDELDTVRVERSTMRTPMHDYGHDDD